MHNTVLLNGFSIYGDHGREQLPLAGPSPVVVCAIIGTRKYGQSKSDGISTSRCTDEFIGAATYCGYLYTTPATTWKIGTEIPSSARPETAKTRARSAVSSHNTVTLPAGNLFYCSLPGKFGPTATWANLALPLPPVRLAVLRDAPRLVNHDASPSPLDGSHPHSPLACSRFLLPCPTDPFASSKSSLPRRAAGLFRNCVWRLSHPVVSTPRFRWLIRFVSARCSGPPPRLPLYVALPRAVTGHRLSNWTP